MALRRIGQILVDLGFLTEDRVKVILEEQRQRPTELFGQVAIGMGLLTDEHLVQGLAEQMGLQVISLAELVVPPNVLAMITEPMAQLYRVVPVSFEDEHAHDRHVRSAEAVGGRRVAELPGFRRAGRGGDGEGRAQGPDAVLCRRGRERRDPDRRHGAGRRPGRPPPRPWRRACWT